MELLDVTDHKQCVWQSDACCSGSGLQQTIWKRDEALCRTLTTGRAVASVKADCQQRHGFVPVVEDRAQFVELVKHLNWCHTGEQKDACSEYFSAERIRAIDWRLSRLGISSEPPSNGGVGAGRSACLHFYGVSERAPKRRGRLPYERSSSPADE